MKELDEEQKEAVKKLYDFLKEEESNRNAWHKGLHLIGLEELTDDEKEKMVQILEPIKEKHGAAVKQITKLKQQLGLED